MDIKDFLFILSGMLTTLQYTLIAVIFGFVIGFPVSVMRISKLKIARLLAQCYVSIIRGTPVLLQLSIWYFAFPRLTGINLSAFSAGTIAFSINSSAYISEIIRSGIIAIDKGQAEAAKALGIKKRDVLFDIILPQALKNISPAIINEIVSMTKETAIIGAIGVTDLMRRAQLVSAEKYDFFKPLIAAAIGYYCLSVLITSLYAIVERFFKLR